MKFSGTVEIAAPRASVFAFVTDPTKVAMCGPGVESVEVVDETHFRVKAKVGVGFIRTHFLIEMHLAHVEAPTTAWITGRGHAPGSAVDGSARMELRELAPDRTAMEWESDVTIAGTLASVGARLIEGTARKMIDQTFDCIRAKVEA